MNIVETSIRRPVFTWMIMFGLIVFGAMSFTKLGVSEFPDVDFPYVNVTVELEGAAPQVVELDVIEPLEKALSVVPGVINMSSTARQGSAEISLEFGLNKNIDVAVNEVQGALSRAMGQLPSDIRPPTVKKTNRDDQPIMWLSVSSKTKTPQELMKIVDNDVRDAFQSIEGVSDVSLGGYIDPTLRVSLRKDKLLQYQLTANDVLSAIQREHVERPAGRIENQKNEISIRTFGEALSVEDFQNISISSRGGGVNYRPIPLKNIADVSLSVDELRSFNRTNGETAIGVGVKKQPGANSVRVAQIVKRKVEDLKTVLPADVVLAVRFDMTQFIEEAVHELNFTLILSAFLTALVCWLFLGSLSATVNVVLAIPTSIVGTFIFFHIFGYTLNTFTLLGLSLAIGIVVDDAIMVLENIVRAHENGESRMNAAIKGANEVSGAALAATLAIIAIFLPVAFMDGIIGKYFLQFGVTLSIAVALSLIEALTLTPMRCSQFLNVTHSENGIQKWMNGVFKDLSVWYEKAVYFSIERAWWILSFAVAVFLFSFFLVGKLGKELLPVQDQSRLMARLQTPVGSSLAFTDQKVREFEKLLLSKKEVKGVFASVGGGRSNTAFLFITLVPKSERDQSANQFAQILRKEMRTIQGLKGFVSDPSQGGLGGRRGSPIQFVVRGPEWDGLLKYSALMMEEMDKLGTLTDIDTGAIEGAPEIQIVPDREAAKQFGIEVADLSETVSILMAGVRAGKFSDGGHRYDVRVGLSQKDKTDISELKDIRVRNNRGELIPLTSVVKLIDGKSLQSITRENRSRAITLQAGLKPGSSQANELVAIKAISERILPPGYSILISGAAKTYEESSKSLLFALLFGILVSYMVLASQYNSFLDPFLILMSLPMSLTGAFLALYVGGQSLNIYSMIGIILLMGIVKKNAILLVSFTTETLFGKDSDSKLATVQHWLTKAKNGNGRVLKKTDLALLYACPLRLRPILMTSFATIAGALPAAFAIGPGAESRIPMALAVIGGVALSTLLTLFVVPSAYSLLKRHRVAG
jgi:hydrophobe/amphiphile efflux-1 (HAE1) family protein